VECEHVAFEPVRVSWPQERIIAADANFLVVDKLWGLPVHGGHASVDDIVTRLRRWLEQTGESDYLAVHQRLDRDASGVLLFVRNPELNVTVANAFREHSIERRYLAVVRDSGLPVKQTLSDRMEAPSKGPSRIVMSGGVHAQAELHVIQRHNGLALVELTPHTGRRHQLRLQLAHRGAPIVGDSLYAGPAGPRLMLHATRLGIPALNLNFAAQLPQEFRNWKELFDLGSPLRVRQTLVDSAHRRAPWFFGHTTAFRVVNDRGDGLEGVRADRYGDWAVLELATEQALARREELVRDVAEWGCRGVYVKARIRTDLRHSEASTWVPAVPDLGEAAPETFVVREGNLKFEVSLSDGFDTGLYLDQRENRQSVLEAAHGCRVLNLFSYTCSFTVAALAGGATSTTSVDLSRRALNRGHKNFVLNGFEPNSTHRLLRAEAVQFAGRAAARNEKYDLIIIDPPSFATVGKGKVFRLEREWDTLIDVALRLLDKGGQCLLVTHEIPERARLLRQRVLSGVRRSGRSCLSLRDLPSPSDCPAYRDDPFPSRSLWLKLE